MFFNIVDECVSIYGFTDFNNTIKVDMIFVDCYVVDCCGPRPIKLPSENQNMNHRLYQTYGVLKFRT